MQNNFILCKPYYCYYLFLLLFPFNLKMFISIFWEENDNLSSTLLMRSFLRSRSLPEITWRLSDDCLCNVSFNHFLKKKHFLLLFLFNHTRPRMKWNQHIFNCRMFFTNCSTYCTKQKNVEALGDSLSLNYLSLGED